MAEFNCTDINGLAVSQFIFNEDGTVTGVVSTGSTASNPNDSFETTMGGGLKTPSLLGEGLSTSKVSQACCEALNFNWEPSTNTCYWTQTCDNSRPDFKISLGAKGNDGAIFQVDENETCQLQVTFDYLFQFNCDDIVDCLEDDIVENGLIIDAQNAVDDKLVEILNLENIITGITQQISDAELLCSQTISQLNEDINDKTVECNAIQDQIDTYQALLDAADPESPEAAVYQSNLTVFQAQLVACNTELTSLTNQLQLVTDNCDVQTALLNQDLQEHQDLLDQCQEDLIDLQNEATTLGQVDDAASEGVVNCLSIFENLDVCVVLDKITQQQEPIEIDGQVSYENVNALETVHEEQLFKIDNIVDHFALNCNTGILLSGSSACKTQIEQCVILNLSADCFVVSACTFNSDWLHHEFIISDEATLSGITNEKVKLGFVVKDCECDFSILVDRISINKLCSAVEREDIFVSRCPSFEFERICDNKKSWVAEETNQEREFFLKQRETDYDVNHHKLVVNTKEVDLDISPANAIETDVWCYMRDNEAFLGCSTGTTANTVDCTTCITGNCGDVNLNIDDLLTTEVSAITTVKEFENVLCSELIDAKSRKTISAYPTLRALYERYRDGFQNNPTSSAFDYFKMDDFVSLVGDYWVDLIEQVIPSTTIWGSTIKYRNTIFDKDKFQYKKYSLFSCTAHGGVSYPSPTSGSQSTVEVITTDLSIPEYVGADCLAPSGATTICDGVIIKQIDHGSEFIGSVVVVGPALIPPQVVGEEVIAVTECDLVASDIRFDFKAGTGIAIPIVLGGTAPFSYVWGIESATGNFTSWTIDAVGTNGTVQLSGPVATQVDNICLRVTVTDANDCVSTITRCLTPQATF